ncbi:aminotransferase class IV family protein [Vibrio mimicus]
MTTSIFTYQTLLNGQLVPSSEMTNLAFSGFAHFTALQVRNKRIKGLDLHLGRLRIASMKLYGRALSDDLVLSHINLAIKNGPENQSITITIFSPKGEFTTESMHSEPAILIRTSPPENGPLGPLRLAVIHHERTLPEIKHVGEIGKTYYLHQAKRQGFDDAVFINKNGNLSEGTIWNLAFWDGKSVIWPKADMLEGTMMEIIKRQLTKLNIPQRCEPINLNQLPKLKGAVVMNSWTPGICVTEISSNKFKSSDQLVSILRKAYDYEPEESALADKI